MNNVKTDGSRNFEGKIFNTVYVETDVGIEIIKKYLTEEFGLPTNSINNQLRWNLDLENPIINQSVLMIIQIDSVFHHEGNQRIFDYVNMDVILTNQNENDLLIDKKTRTTAKDVFQELFNKINK